MVATSKYLKSDNLPFLFVFIAVNLIVFALVSHFSFQDLSTAIEWFDDNSKVIIGIIMGIGIVLMTVISNLASPLFKAFLIFWRWPNPLPGHRAFSYYLPRDPRIDQERLREQIGAFPEDPREQNTLWYYIYQKHRKEPSVAGAHKDFLLTRDLTWLSIVFLLLLGSLAISVGKSSTQRLYYPMYLLGQFLITDIAARRNGIRFVLNVLAIEAVREDD